MIRSSKDLDSSSWKLLVSHADNSYYVARTLLSQGVHFYGLFCAQQCVELYLKALLLHANAKVRLTHSLKDLLADARQLQPNQTAFVQSDLAEIICLRFEPFYELPRYPTRSTSPQSGAWFWFQREDEQTLDYFVHRMRELLVIPPGEWDILSTQGNFFLQLVHQLSPQLDALFVKDNLNFASPL